MSRAFRNRASAYVHTGKFDQAVSDCTEAIKIDPNYAMAFFTRGQAYVKLGKTKEAKADELKYADLTKIIWKSATPNDPAYMLPKAEDIYLRPATARC
jgi:tetratricopeptide (TPR) repeat protein